jgi:glycosyltransferase involved in cell wall biosynthesis
VSDPTGRSDALPRLDVIVPTFQNLDELRECLAALDQQSSVELRVLVCVDGSTDGTLEWLSSAAFGFELIVLTHPDGRNHGRAQARNLALPHLRNEWLLLLDSDMRLEPGAAARHCALLSERDCVSVGAIEYRRTEGNLWARYLNTRGRNRYRDGATLSFNQFVTANSALSSTDFVRLGGFDWDLETYAGEDTEFAYRLATKGGRPFVYNSAALAWTVEDKTVEQAMAQFRAYGRTNLRTIHRKHPAMPHVFMTDRLGSLRLRDRMFRAVLNPSTDALARILLRWGPFAIQRRVLNYQVIRAVTSGWCEAERTEPFR